MIGWIKLHRTIQNSKFGKNPELFHLFVILLLKANHKDGHTRDGTLIRAGQFMTSKIGLANEFKYNEMKMHRMLARLESEGQIVASSNTKNTIITVTNWEQYQQSDGVIDEPMRIEQGSDEEQVMTNKNANNNKNKKKIIPSDLALKILKELNDTCLMSHKPNKSNIGHINARVSEGYTYDDFVAVIHHRKAQWLNNAKMHECLRPRTLFNGNFDDYLQAAKVGLKPRTDPLMALAQKHLDEELK